jgi:glycine betaine/proline transport system substrate-binding protein
MKIKLSSRNAIASLFIAFGLVLSACSGAGVDQQASTDTSGSTSETAQAADCGEWSIAMHAWVGYTASAQVLTNVAEELGCTINQVSLSEAGVTYDAMEAGSVDVIVEDWGGGRWAEWTDRGQVVEVGANGNIGKIGMFIPAWMVEEYPDITDASNLNKYAELFKTSESGSKGAWYEGPPGYTTVGEKMIAAGDLNFQVISTGSEAALIELFTQAVDNQTPALGYWWEPHPLFAELDLARVNWPDSDWEATEEADGNTDYPETPLIKLASAKLMDSGDPFANLVRNFKWTNADQNQVAADIESGTDPKVAAQKWIDANRAIVDSWIG